jgi:hypothetical protein
LSTLCTGEIHRRLAPAEARTWADACEYFAKVLEHQRLPLADGIWTVCDWVGEVRWYLKAMGEQRYLPAPDGPYPTPTNPAPAVQAEDPSPGPAQDQIASLREEMGEIKDLLKRQVASETVKDWYSVNEVADRTGLSPWTIRQACNQGRIAAEKNPAGRWRVSQEEVLRIQNHGLPKETSLE